MGGPLQTFRYAPVAPNLSATVRLLIRCDSDHETFTIGSWQNTQATQVALDRRLNVFLPCVFRDTGILARPRWALLRYTGALPAGQTGQIVRVPVFRPFTAVHVVGAVGTYRGLPIVVDKIADGRPREDGTSV